MGGTKLLVGLGNPGKEYANTRHNAGFLAVELLAKLRGCSWEIERSFEARLARVQYGIGEKIILCEPQTFMNASGEAVGKIAKYFRLTPEEILVLVDDADLPLGTLRLRAEGSSGGHHGLESIERHLGSTKFARQKIGIGRLGPRHREISNYVLGNFSTEEIPLLNQVLEKAVQQVECWIMEGPMPAMNKFNGSIIPK
jgi:PTH1 family peptidyl-tRNA hydrolase